MSTSSNNESEVFQRLFSTLKDGLRSGISSLADETFSQGLIPEDVRSKVNTIGLAQDVKTSYLLSAVHDRIKGNRDTYHQFANILRDIPAFRYLSERMRDEINKLLASTEDRMSESSTSAQTPRQHRCRLNISTSGNIA